MKPAFASLRARLLAWYSAVLLTVLATLVAVAVWAIWRATVLDLDVRLTVTATRLAQAVDRDQDGRFEINLAADDFAAFSSVEDGPYYAIWTTGGALVDQSDPLIDVTSPGAPQTRFRDGRREVVVRGGEDVLVLVGQSLREARSDRWTAILALGGAAGAALVLAFAGGWLLVGRALAPVARIAETAEAMTESNLGLRIDVRQADDELGRVAAALNRAFDRLQEAFERQTRFTADASHELRTPLTLQIAEIEWALTRPRAAADYEQALGVALLAAQRMRAIIEGLLTLARADAGAIPLRRRAVDLTDLAREVTGTLSAAAAERRIALTVDGPPAVVSGDPDRLRELIANLLSNAVRYSTAGGTVTCVIAIANARASLEVSDAGPGIEPDDLPHIFERFYRANRDRSRVAGAGLGLAICKWIAESHGGRIQCQSSVGRGTRFTVELPTEGAGSAA
jgi:heavy metal sensor kinase